MKIIISHNSAADFWRTVYPVHRRPSRPAHCSAFEEGTVFASSASDVWGLAPTWVNPRFLKSENGVFHVLSLLHSDHSRSDAHMTHSWTTPLPEGSLFALDENVYVSSPEFTFLQLAHSLDFLQLIAYGFELCGTYVFDEHLERGFNTRNVPLVTLDELNNFVESAERSSGRAKARKALRYIQEHSASPMESVCALLLSLPYRYGGYALPKMLLNTKIDVPRSLEVLCPSGYVRADLRVPDTMFVIEYLGGYDHSGWASMQADRGRVVALAEMGFEVVELSSRQVWNLEAFEVVAKRTAKVFNKRIRSDCFGASDARVHLRKMLRSWNDASGRCAL